MADDAPSLDRRALLGAVATGAAASLAGCSVLESGADATVESVADERARSLAEQFAPALYFDRNERWFPTDPRAYESRQDGRTVVDGFDALEGYVRAGGSDDPPAPTAFYHVVEYAASPLAVVQFWLYSAFDQFTTNFHWHDWEVLQVFIDTETDEPQLYVASSHSRSVPNNEYLDPDPDRRPRVLSELGSHSSGLSVNDDADSFQRLAFDDSGADITNSLLEGIENIASIPLAYGLPRDEGLRLPFVVPELDGDPLVEHDRLPSVDASNLLPDGLTIRSFDDLTSPPTELPARETGIHFEYAGRDGVDADRTYDLVSSAELEHIDDFTGPQLSFEFAIPEFAEDQIASHITTTGVPWADDRYDQPASDISETDHRQALADRYEAIGDPSPVNQVVAGVTNAVAAEDAPEDEGLTTVPSPLELFALFESEPEAVPTFQGIAVIQDVPAGEHRLSINGAGVAPHSEPVTVADGSGTTVAGSAGEIPVVARENATKLEIDPDGADSDLDRLAVEDDFAGRLYDAPLSGPDAVYLHRGGAFTTEVRDTDDEVGAFRVNPGEEARTRLDAPRTGKESLATYLVALAEETRAAVAAVAEEVDGDSDDGDADDAGGSGTDADGADGQGGPVRGLVSVLDAIVDAARWAAERAVAGDRGNADRQLEAVATRLDRVETRIEAARGSLPDELANAAEHRLEQARRRTDQAKNAEKL
ncbi:Uncharacterized protein SVXHr_2754 [Halorhabdus sp. SVX81]|uniref:hypothetical protein n=1 Tax=Halorhabdus sp. SVX81 TaxID=2978283 RepID=UPI0023DB33B4|nr:hypothetical protein [Halorhabdus sp. SVX81]WEL18897.1 Uncharacterized protein SVXHr_2754 [Halorhabdus sp. SVX81]